MGGHALFLCDLTGIAAQPWAEAGYECWCIDIEHSIRKPRVEQNGAGLIHFVWGDVRNFRPPSGLDPRSLVFGCAMTPCTHVAGSGARDFATKGGAMLRDAIEMFDAAGVILAWSGAPYYRENPVGYFSTIPHIGKPDHYFDPCDYAGWCEADNYTKRTCLWTGNGFVMPPPQPAPWLGEPDDRIHKATPSDDRGSIRSASPLGFNRAVFAANRPDRVRAAA